MKHFMAGLVGAYIGGVVGAVCNTVATLLLFVLMALLAGKSFWIGYLLFAAWFGMVLGGTTGSAIGLRCSGATGLSRLVAATGALFVQWAVFRPGVHHDHEVWATAAIPLIWAGGLFVWAVVYRTPRRT
jgi:hypothetical protein